MSCIENEIILENLYEKYLDLGYDKDMASELALRSLQIYNEYHFCLPR